MDYQTNTKAEIRWLLKISKKYCAAILIFTFLGAVSIALSLFSGVASKYLIDFVVDFSKTDGEVISVALIMAAAVISGIIVKAFYSRISAKTSITVHNEVRSNIFSKILRFKWEDLKLLSGGDLINRINVDTSTVASCTVSGIPSLFSAAVQFIGALIILLIYDPVMALISLIAVPLAGLSSRYLVTRLRDYNSKIRRLDSNMMTFHDNAFANLQQIKAFGISSGFERRLGKLQDEYKNTYLSYNTLTVVTGMILALVGLLVYAGCYGWGAFSLRTGNITYGTLMLFLQMSSNLSSAFSSLLTLVPSLIQAFTSAGRLMELEDMPEEEPMCEITASSATIKLDNISFMYKDGSENVLENSSMLIQSGSIVALAGPSGEGKTTLLRLLLGLISPSGGTAQIIADGEIYTISPKTRGLFSYVPQGNTVFSGSIKENLLLMNSKATECQLWEALEAACADEFVKALPDGLDTVIGEHGAGLSEGQAQRIAVARAILCPAPVILFDEATSALDMELEKKLLSNIKEKSNKTCIISTHRPAALEICNKIYRITEKQTKECSL